jgi:hypothetical protein
LYSTMDYDTDLFGDMPEPFEVFQPIPSALSDPQLPRELRRLSLTFFVIDQPGDAPELVPAHELDTKPLIEPRTIPLTDKTNLSPTRMNSEAPSVDKPPPSPRPSFRTLPSMTTAEQARPLFPGLSEFTARPPIAAQTNDDGQAPRASPVSPQTSRSAPELLPMSTTQPSASASSSAADLKSTDTFKTRTSFDASQSSPLVSKAHNAKQSSSSKPTNVPPVTTTKSAIPPTFTPNASPSFNSPANTKPKHKSPLGSQPPIFAAESNTKASSHQYSAAHLNKATHNLAAIGFLEPHGILQQYIEHIATAQIEDALRQFEREEPLRAASQFYFCPVSPFFPLTCVSESARRHLLSKKYFTAWYSIYWRKKLHRDATSRREQLTQSIRKESQRKARGDAELEAILEAQKQKVRVQAEQLRRSQEDPNPPVLVPRIWHGPQKSSLAGHKRKSFDGDELSATMNGNSSRKVAKDHGHRRSQNVSSLSNMSKPSSFGKVNAYSSPPRLSSSTFLGRSILLDRGVGSVAKRPMRGRKTDSTHTDYFRLKALGVDPDTPFIPETKSSLERKRRRQEELSHLAPRKRASNSSSMKAQSLGQVEASSSVSPQASRNITAPETSFSTSQQTQSEAQSRSLDDDHEFLRQIREVREAMSEDTQWFRTQAAEIEKEVEKQEELRRSASQRSSTSGTGIAASDSNTGLSRVNGYEYSPVIPRSGFLSRTEQRIRATGAHGLATKNVRDYLPVAMSKSTRAAMIDDEERSRAKMRKGRTRQGEKDSKHIYESDENEEEDIIDMEEGSTTRTWRGQLNHKHRLPSSNHPSQTHDERRIDSESGNGEFAPYQSNASHPKSLALDDALYDDDDDEGRGGGEEEEEEEEEGEENEQEELEGVEQEEEYVYESYNGIDEGNEGEDEAEYDEADEDVVDEDRSQTDSTTSANLAGGQGQPSGRANPFHMKLRNATPEARPSPDQDNALGGMQMSRATSGTGVSVDDALVLSD